MKNKTGKIAGCVIGITSFLFAFKVLVLDRTAPADELAPGIVVIAALLNGLLFGYLGSRVQQYFTDRRV